MLGDSFENVARQGLSFQRSQNGGRFTPMTARIRSISSWRRRVERDRSAAAGAKEESIFDLLPRNIEGAIGPAGKAIDEAVAAAMAAFRISDPSASAPALAQGLKLTREALAAAIDPQSRHLLRIKDQQFQDAINAAIGAQLTAITDPPLMGAPVPGQTFGVDARLEVRGAVIEKPQVTLVGPPGLSRYRVAAISGHGGRRCAAEHEAVLLSQRVAGKPLHPHGSQSQFGRPETPAPLVASARYFVGEVHVEIKMPVNRGSQRHHTAIWCVQCVPCHG